MMDAGGVYHLLAQARPVEDPICPRLSEECGAEAPWDVLATGTPRMASESITWMGPENDTAEAVPIVGSRPAKYVELEGGLPALAITGNAENARRVSCPESLTEVHRRQEVLTSVEAAGIQGCTTSRHLSDR